MTHSCIPPYNVPLQIEFRLSIIIKNELIINRKMFWFSFFRHIYREIYFFPRFSYTVYYVRLRKLPEFTAVNISIYFFPLQFKYSHLNSLLVLSSRIGNIHLFIIQWKWIANDRRKIEEKWEKSETFWVTYSVTTFLSNCWNVISI